VEWLKVKALSSSRSTTKGKKEKEMLQWSVCQALHKSINYQLIHVHFSHCLLCQVMGLL
jgi:hypothetical protein